MKDAQKMLSGGLTCGYVERMWGEDDIEEERGIHGIEIIKKSMDSGIAAVVWDISDIILDKATRKSIGDLLRGAKELEEKALALLEA